MAEASACPADAGRSAGRRNGVSTQQGSTERPLSGKPSPAVYQSRLSHAASLGHDLSAERIRELCSELETEFRRESGLSPVEYNASRNDILDKLIAQKNVPEGLGEFIVGMYRDRTHDTTWRAYCVQHFAPYFETRWSRRAAPADDPEADAILEACWDAARESDGPIAGAALIGLEKLSRVDPRFDRNRLTGTVLSYAMNPGCPAPTRITALQLCGLMGRAEILPTARNLAVEAQSMHLRVTAIAAIGDVGESSDIRLLKGLALPSEAHAVRNAAEGALKRLRAVRREAGAVAGPK